MQVLGVDHLAMQYDLGVNCHVLALHTHCNTSHVTCIVTYLCFVQESSFWRASRTLW